MKASSGISYSQLIPNPPLPSAVVELRPAGQGAVEAQLAVTVEGIDLAIRLLGRAIGGGGGGGGIHPNLLAFSLGER